MRNLGLDILRFVAVLLVLGNHFRLPEHSGSTLSAALRIWQRGGWVGVDLFFVLSGFLVSSLLFQEHKLTGKVDLKRFLIRRGFKIYPAFWFFLLVTVLVKSLKESGVSFRGILGELLFLQNYVGRIWNHTWSLAVEEHFYLGIAILLGCWVRSKTARPFAAIPKLFLWIGFACLLMRIGTSVAFSEYSFYRDLAPTHLRIDSLSFGVLLSYFCNFHNAEQKLARLPTWMAFMIGGILLSPAFLFDRESNRWLVTIGVTWFYVGSGFILVGALRFPENRTVLMNLLGSLGAASYSIYLWHMPVNVWGCKFILKSTGLSENHLMYFLVYLVGSCLVGLAMSRLIELPVLRIRDLFFPSMTRPPGASSEARGG